MTAKILTIGYIAALFLLLGWQGVVGAFTGFLLFHVAHRAQYGFWFGGN